MTGRTRSPDAAPPANAAEAPRAERLKAALKANMARRKAQARARADSTVDPEDGTDGQAQDKGQA